ncbi:MAG: hypothetical protein AAGH78_17565 [Cyanobacteria bacterium P01_H01_bin.58]
MTDQPNPELLAEVTAFVDALDIDVLRELCSELQVVQQDLELRDQILLEIALKRLAALDTNALDSREAASASAIANNLKAFERP